MPCAAQIPTDSLVGHYLLEGSPADSSGLGNDGILIGDITPTEDRFGRADGAYLLSGGHIDLGNPEVFQFSDAITISAWIRLDTMTGAWVAVASKWDGTGYFLGITPEADIIRFNIGDGGVVNGEPTDFSAWQQVAATFDGSIVSIYQNGERVSSLQHNLEILNNGFNLLLGRQSENKVITPFMGALDDVLIYNRALSNEEIQQVFEEGLMEPPVSTQNIIPDSYVNICLLYTSDAADE